MTARRHLSQIQFSDLSYDKDISAGMGSIVASHPDPMIGASAAHIYWNTNPKYKAVPLGGITSVGVHPDLQRQGLATHLFRMAQEMDPRVQHGPASAQTPAGKKWAKKVPNSG